MEDWLMSKKLEEAERVAHLRNNDDKDEIFACVREQQHVNSFKNFLRSQEQKTRLSKRQANNINAK